MGIHDPSSRLPVRPFVLAAREAALERPWTGRRDYAERRVYRTHPVPAILQDGPELRITRAMDKWAEEVANGLRHDGTDADYLARELADFIDAHVDEYGQYEE